MLIIIRRAFILITFFCLQSIAINMKNSRGAKIIREVGFNGMQIMPILYLFGPV